MTDVTFLVGLLVYLIPTLVARARKNPQTSIIAVVNILTGWTFLGWVGTLIWAFNSRPVFTLRVPTVTARAMKNVGRAPGIPATASPTKGHSSNVYAAERECSNCHAWIPIMATTCPKCGREAYVSSTT